MGEVLKLHAETKDMEDGEGVTFHIYDEHKREVYSAGSIVKDGEAEAEWTYQWNGEKLDAKPRLIFEVTGNRCKKAESDEMEVGAKINIKIIDQYSDTIEDIETELFSQDESYNFTTDSDGKIEKDDLIPGKYELEFKLTEEQESYFIQTENGLRRQLDLEKENIIELKRNSGVVS